MALSSSALSPPFTTTHSSSSSAASLPNLRLTTSLPFQSTSHNTTRQCLSINTTSPNPKWRTQVSFFTGLLNNSNKTKNAEAIKEELLEAIAPLDRGAEATPEDQLEIERIVRKLEAVNPTKEPLKSGLLDGKWQLLYTTSVSILQTTRPKLLRSKGNYQGINVDTLRAQNMESWPFFNQVTADLTPLNSRKVAVQFDYFKIGGLIPVKAPETAKGELEFTYLDEELRVSRGDKGNLFVLKMIDPSYRVPTK